MAKNPPSRALPVRLITGENGQSRKTGTPLATIADAPSCTLDTATACSRGSWGGARNRADRTSRNLSSAMVLAMIAAANHAERIGLAFNRHWTVHYQLAGIAERDGAAFVGRLLALARKHCRRAAGDFAAVWAREGGDGKGGHVHILLHLPSGVTLRNRTRRWIAAAGGKAVRRASRVRTIRGSGGGAEPGEHYRVNADAVLAYLLKGASTETGKTLKLPRSGEAGPIIGKRCGWTVNIGQQAQARSRA